MDDNFMFTIAGQMLRNDIASIAYSLRVIAQELTDKRKEKQEDDKDNNQHRQ